MKTIGKILSMAFMEKDEKQTQVLFVLEINNKIVVSGIVINIDTELGKVILSVLKDCNRLSWLGD